MKNVLDKNLALVLGNWLNDEAIGADNGRNAYLSEFEKRKADFEKPFEDPSNTNAQKVKSHYNRLRVWVSDYAEHDLVHSDQATARLIFCSLMFVAGSYREQCLLESDSYEQYMIKRHESGPLGIDLNAVVHDELTAQSNLSTDPTSRLDHILTRTVATNEESLDIHKQLHASPDHITIGAVDCTPPVEAVVHTQRLWASLTVAQIAVAASFRGGDYARVPFFEPKSITDQIALQYPLSQI